MMAMLLEDESLAPKESERFEMYLHKRVEFGIKQNEEMIHLFISLLTITVVYEAPSSIILRPTVLTKTMIEKIKKELVELKESLELEKPEVFKGETIVVKDGAGPSSSVSNPLNTGAVGDFKAL